MYVIRSQVPGGEALLLADDYSWSEYLPDVRVQLVPGTVHEDLIHPPNVKHVAKLIQAELDGTEIPTDQFQESMIREILRPPPSG